MVSNDKCQTHKQFSQRRQRVEAAEKYNVKINYVRNEIQDINKEIERLNEQKKQKQDELNQITDEKFHDLMPLYNNDQLMKEILSFGRETTFSHSLVDELANKFSHSINEDNATQSDIDTIVAIEVTINKEIPHTNRFMDILDVFGSKIEIANKEGKSNEN